GPEDPRLFMDPTGIPYVVFNMDPGLGHRRMFMLNLATKKIVALRIINRKQEEWEKNWAPLISEGNLYFVQQLNPLTIGILRGGTPFVKLAAVDENEDYYVSLARSNVKCFSCAHSIYRPHFFIIKKKAMQFTTLFVSNVVSFSGLVFNETVPNQVYNSDLICKYKRIMIPYSLSFVNDDAIVSVAIQDVQTKVLAQMMKTATM
ncbi:hypothetical protein ROZALSC1DRAFT_29336, partial [Rozella allomycis CSF55]